MSRFWRLNRWLLMLVSVLVVAVVACGGSDDNGATATSGSGASGTTATATVRPGATATATRTAGGLGDLFADACQSIDLIANITGETITGTTSDSPPSSAARSATNYFTPIITGALGDASVECYIEVVEDDSYGLYFVYDLDRPAPVNATELLKSEFLSNSIAEDDITEFSVNFSGVSLSTVSISDLMDLNLDEGLSGEAVLFVSEQAVIVTISADMSGSGSRVDPTSTPSGSNPTVTPGSGGSSPTVIPAGAAGQVDGLIRQMLERTLGVQLNVVSEISTSSGGVDSVVLSYAPVGVIGTGFVDAATAAVNELGGEVTTSFSSDGNSLVFFEGMPVNAKTGTGSLTFDGESLVVTMTIE